MVCVEVGGEGERVCAPLVVSIKTDALVQIEIIYTDLVNSHEGTMN